MAEYFTVKAFEAIVKELTASNVRFMVVGGLAMQAHGLDRVTYDVDLVIQLESSNIIQAFDALTRAGYRPSVPITALQFADRSTRESLCSEKDMVVLNFWSDRFPPTKLDVFVTEPFDFDAEYSNALRDNGMAGVELCFPRVETLLAMKRLAHRPKDLNDIAFLENLDR